MPARGELVEGFAGIVKAHVAFESDLTRRHIPAVFLRGAENHLFDAFRALHDHVAR